MSGNLHLTRNSLVFGILANFVLIPAFCQEPLSFPRWLKSYPGANPTVRSSDSLAESSYTTAADPAEIVTHYGTLFEAAGLPFQANPDGLGTSIRAEVPECDLLIQIRSRAEGTFVDVNCSSKTASSPSAPSDIKVTMSRPQSTRVGATAAPATAPAPGRHLTADELMEQHHRIAAEMGLHRVHPDAPAPPLIWPPWLVHINSAALRTQRGANYAKDAMLSAQYNTNAPMTEIYHFYRDLLNTHEYPARSSMSTGQTQTGIQQNAIGYVEGYNYPDGAPGAYSTIDVRFSRSVLNGPITVTMRFTTHEYIAKRGY